MGKSRERTFSSLTISKHHLCFEQMLCMTKQFTFLKAILVPGGMQVIFSIHGGFPAAQRKPVITLGYQPPEGTGGASS